MNIPKHEMARLGKTVLDASRPLPSSWDKTWSELTQDPEFLRLHKLVCEELSKAGIKYSTRIEAYPAC